MHVLFGFGVLFLILLLICIYLCLATAQREARPKRCPRTKAAAHLPHTIKYGGKCYEVFTCSEECGKSIKKLVDTSPSAFADKYSAVQHEMQGKSGLHLHHHISKEPVQFALEVAC